MKQQKLAVCVTPEQITFSFGDKPTRSMAIPNYEEYSYHSQSDCNGSNSSVMHHRARSSYRCSHELCEIRGTGTAAHPNNSSINTTNPSQQVSFLHQLITELSAIYNTLANTSITSVTENSARIRHHPGFLKQELGEISTGSNGPNLPDVVSCHHTNTAAPDLRPLIDSYDEHDGAHKKDAFLQPTINLSLEIACQSIGSDLRRIADTFTEVSVERRRGMISSNRNTQQSLKMEVGLKIVLPTVVVCIGYFYLLKST